MFHSLGEWSGKLALEAKEIASKRAADALQIAAKKMGELSEMLQEPTERYFETLGVTRGTPFLTISIMGSQSGGKSTLLNHMFGTRFKQMDPNPEAFGQNTVGMWLSKSLKPKGTTVFVIDNEGCDGHERTDKQMQDLERRYALMALRASDILLLNMSCGNAGRVEGANLTLIKTMIEAKLQQLAKSVRTSGPGVKMVKSTLVVVLRDMIMPIEKNLAPYQAIFMKNLRHTFEKAKKPEELDSPSFDDCFKVFVTGLPDYREHETSFRKACKELRHKLTYTPDHTPEDPKHGEFVPLVRNELTLTVDLLPQQFRIMWDGIANDPNLDWHDYEAETFQNLCTRTARATQEKLMQSLAWTDLKAKCAEHLVPDIKLQMYNMMARAVTEYDEALEEMICHDAQFKQSQRREMCQLIAEEMQTAFFRPALMTIADKLWQEALPRMSAAPAKDAKKSIFDGVARQFDAQAVLPQLTESDMREILGDDFSDEDDDEEEEEEEGVEQEETEDNSSHAADDNGGSAALVDALDWSYEVLVAKKHLNKRFADKFGDKEEKQLAKKEYEEAQDQSVKNSTAYKAAMYLIDKSIGGIGCILDGAKELAQSYTADKSYTGNDARVNSLIRYECAKAGAGGFITGLGGFATAPITIPADLLGNWLLQGRLVATIAFIYGHSLEDDRVRTMILLTVLGSGMTDVLKEAGVVVGGKVAMNALKQVPGRALIAINKAVGFRLITKAGSTGVINLIKWLPIVGAAVGGSVNVIGAASVGNLAMQHFKPDFSV